MGWRIVGDLLTAEISEKQARSIKYQLTVAKLPSPRTSTTSSSTSATINQTLVNDLAAGGFAQQRNAVLVGSTGTGKTHLAIAIAKLHPLVTAQPVLLNVVDLVNRLETETRSGHKRAAPANIDPPDCSSPSRSAICRSLVEAVSSFVFNVVDELGDIKSSSPRTSPSANGPAYSATWMTTALLTQSPDPPLRHRRNQQRQQHQSEPTSPLFTSPQSPPCDQLDGPRASISAVGRVILDYGQIPIAAIDSQLCAAAAAAIVVADKTIDGVSLQA